MKLQPVFKPRLSAKPKMNYRNLGNKSFCYCKITFIETIEAIVIETVPATLCDLMSYIYMLIIKNYAKNNAN